MTKAGGPETHDISQPMPEAEQEAPSWPRLKKCVRGSAKAALVLSGAVGVFHVQNPEVIPAIEAWYTYQKPDEYDMIPERVGCDVSKYEYYQPPIQSTQPDVIAGGGDVSYQEDGDELFQRVASVASLARSFDETSVAPYEYNRKLFSLDGNYFDAFVGEHKTSIGTTMRFHMREGDVEYSVDYEALETMIRNVFELRHLYKHPEVRRIMDCKTDQVLHGLALFGKRMDVNLIANGDMGLEGNHVVRRGAEGAHSSGLGITGTGIRLGPFKPTPDQMLIVAGGNSSLRPSEYVLNRRFLHELAHTMIFHDLSDTISELDEQERFIRYVEGTLMEHYIATGSLPRAIVLNKS